ncbi:MAG: prohibitin family protein, partial [Acidobacteria bacterium]|nr:prohibitin family protein [Acidobacteriota bacterium]
MPEYSIGEFRDFRIPPGIGKKIVAITAVIVALILAAGSMGIVGAGQRGVLLRFGAVTGTVKEEGLYFKIPFAEQVVLMSTQIQKYTAPVGSSSKDLQVVTTEVTLN